MAIPKHTPFEASDVQLPPEQPKTPFRTLEEIKRAIKRGGLSKSAVAALWECLYLTSKQIRDLLEYVEVNSSRPFLYPMLCAAAYTGARRSELCRSTIDDLDLAARIVHIRQKKNKERSQTYSL